MINYQDSLFDNMEKLAEKEANEIEDWTQEILDTDTRMLNMIDEVENGIKNNDTRYINVPKKYKS